MSDQGAREPVQLDEAMAAVGRELGIPAPDDLAAIANAWPEIIGDALAGHAAVRSIRDGVCTIDANSTAKIAPEAPRLAYSGWWRCASQVPAALTSRPKA